MVLIDALIQQIRPVPEPFQGSGELMSHPEHGASLPINDETSEVQNRPWLVRWWSSWHPCYVNCRHRTTVLWSVALLCVYAFSPSLCVVVVFLGKNKRTANGLKGGRKKREVAAGVGSVEG